MTRRLTTLCRALATTALVTLAGAPAASATVFDGLRAPSFALEASEAAEPGAIYYAEGGQIFAREPGAEEPTPIASGREPAVSSDGERLAFIRTEEGTDELVIAAADGSGADVAHTATGSGEGFGPRAT